MATIDWDLHKLCKGRDEAKTRDRGQERLMPNGARFTNKSVKLSCILYGLQIICGYYVLKCTVSKLRSHFFLNCVFTLLINGEFYKN